MQSSESAALSRGAFAFPFKNTVAAALIIFAILLPLSHGFRVPAVPMDEGSLLVYPERMLKGGLPYRDFETFYGPANLWMLGCAYKFFGANIFVERAVGLLYRVAILTGMFVLTNKPGTLLAVGCTAISGFLLICTWLAAYAWMGALACGLWSVLIAGRSESQPRCFAGGLLAGCALLFRVDLAIAIIAASLPLLWGMNFRGRVAYILGASVALIPLLALIIAAGANEVLDNLFVFPVVYSSPARRLPISSARGYVIALFVAHAVASVVNVVAGFVAMRNAFARKDARIFLAAGLFGLGLTHQVAQRLDPLHVLHAAQVSLPLFPVGLDVLLARGRIESTKPSRGWLAFVVLTLLGLIAPKFTSIVWQEMTSAVGVNQRDAFFLQRNGRAFPFPDKALAMSAGKLLDELQTLSSPGQRLFVGPADLRRTNSCDTFIYHLLPQLEPASYFLEMNPLSANRPQSRLAADVASADWLVLNRQWDSWQEPNRSAEFGSDAANAVVRNRFERLDEFGPYLLYRKR
jgi:hypothetical protein